MLDFLTERILKVRTAFARGGSAGQLLTEDFINAPIGPPARVKGLPDVFEVGGRVMFNVLAVSRVAKASLIGLLARGLVGRWMRDNLSREMVLGMAKIHAYGLAHRDVKPENMLVSSTGQLSFTDFDTALPFKTSEGSPTVIHCPEKLPGGTLIYLAPELAGCFLNHGSRTVTPAGDAWALGMSLYVLWCDREIYPASVRGEDLVPFISGLTQKEHVQLSFRGCHSIPPELKHLIGGFLDPDPDTRLTPMEAVKNSAFFSSKFRVSYPAAHGEDATAT